MKSLWGSHLARRLWAGWVALGLSLSVSGSLYAASPDEIRVAKRLFQEAEQDQKNERWDEALDKLERVSQIKDTAGVRFHIAVCHEKLGHLVKALESYERAKALAQETEARDVLDVVDTDIERVSAKVAGVSVRVPDGVGPLVVHVDQSVYANLPPGEVVRLDPGTHQVIVKIDGAVRLDRLVSVDEGQHETLQVRDWREPAKPAEPVAEPGAASASVDTEASSSGIPTAALISFGAGAVLGVGGYLAYSKADSLAEESADVCAASISCDPDRADTVRRWDAAALGMWVGAAVGVGAGIALSITAQSEGSSDTALVVSPAQLKLRTTF